MEVCVETCHNKKKKKNSPFLVVLHLDPHRVILPRAFALGFRVRGRLHLMRRDDTHQRGPPHYVSRRSPGAPGFIGLGRSRAPKLYAPCQRCKHCKINAAAQRRRDFGSLLRKVLVAILLNGNSSKIKKIGMCQQWFLMYK